MPLSRIFLSSSALFRKSLKTAVDYTLRYYSSVVGDYERECGNGAAVSCYRAGVRYEFALSDQADQAGAPLETQMKTQHDEIEAMLESGKADPTVLGNKMIAVHAVHKKLEALHRDARTKIIALLTAEQRATLDKMHADNPPFAGH